MCQFEDLLRQEIKKELKDKIKDPYNYYFFEELVEKTLKNIATSLAKKAVKKLP